MDSIVSAACAHQDTLVYLLGFVGVSAAVSWGEKFIDKLPMPAQNVIHFALGHWKAIAIDAGWLKA